MKIYDISQKIFSCAIFPGDPAPSKTVLNRLEDGDVCNLSAFSMCSHNGTHVDAPLHFIKDGKAIDEISTKTFVGYAYVAHHNGAVTKEDAENILSSARTVNANERILIGGKATVSEEAARVFASAGVLLVGNESQTVGPENAPKAVHDILLGANTVLLEGIRLCNVPQGKYILCAAPLNLEGLEGSPCRATLIEL